MARPVNKKKRDLENLTKTRLTVGVDHSTYAGLVRLATSGRYSSMKAVIREGVRVLGKRHDVDMSGLELNPRKEYI